MTSASSAAAETPRPGRPGSLAAAFDPRNNSLNALRLVLATLVIVSHSWPIAGVGPDPTLGGVGLGGWAVAGFFAISGFLITSSRLRTPFLPFLWRRFLRIFPGLWVCLAVIAFVFAPIAALVEDGPDAVGPRSLAKFLLGNGVLQTVEPIGTTLSNVPYSGTWDGSLWTLFYEASCYLILGSLLAVPLIRRRPGPWLWILFAASLAVTFAVYELHWPVPYRLAWLSYLGTYFWAGALLFVHAASIRASVAAVAGLAALTVAAWTSHTEVVAALPLACLALWLGVTLPLQRVGRRNDISYGVYIYAFPIQQLLVLAGAHHLGITAYVTLAICTTIPFAVASWFLIERHAISLKRIPVQARAQTALEAPTL